MANINSYGNNILKYGNRFYANEPLLLTNLYSAYNADGNVDDGLGLRNGTFVGTATYSTGIIGNAVLLNGSSYVSLPTNTHNFTGDFTISLWVYLTSFSSSSKLVSTYTNTGTQRGFTLAITGAGAVTFNGWNAGISVSTLTSSNGVISVNTWTHLTLVYDAGVGVKLYKNGVHLTNGSSSSAISYYTTFYPTIGANKYTATLVDGQLVGRMDAVFFWDRTLDINEIAILYRGGVGKQYPFNN